MAAVASETEQMVDETNAEISAPEKPTDEKLIEEEQKDGGSLSGGNIFPTCRHNVQIFVFGANFNLT